jgi:hypothetical protein
MLGSYYLLVNMFNYDGKFDPTLKRVHPMDTLLWPGSRDRKGGMKIIYLERKRLLGKGISSTGFSDLMKRPNIRNLIMVLELPIPLLPSSKMTVEDGEFRPGFMAGVVLPQRRRIPDDIEGGASVIGVQADCEECSSSASSTGSYISGSCTNSSLSVYDITLHGAGE